MASDQALPETKQMAWRRNPASNDMELYLKSADGLWIHYSNFPELTDLDSEAYSPGWPAFSYLGSLGWSAVKGGPL